MRGIRGGVCMHRILNLQSVTEGVSMVTALCCRHGIQLEWFLTKQMIPTVITLHVHVHVRPCICNMLSSNILILLAK